MEKRQVVALLTVILVLFGLLLGACGPKGVELEAKPYSSSDGSYTIRHPKEWVYEEGDGQVVFHKSGESMGSAELVVFVASMPVPSEIVGAMDAKGLLELAAEQTAAEFNMGNVTELTVGGKKAAAADISGTEEGEQMSGRMVLIMADQVIMVMAAGKAGAWSGFIPIFEAMLNSMTF